MLEKNLKNYSRCELEDLKKTLLNLFCFDAYIPPLKESIYGNKTREKWYQMRGIWSDEDNSLISRWLYIVEFELKKR